MVVDVAVAVVMVGVVVVVVVAVSKEAASVAMSMLVYVDFALFVAMTWAEALDLGGMTFRTVTRSSDATGWDTVGSDIPRLTFSSAQN